MTKYGELLAKRRSIRILNDRMPVSMDEVVERIKEAVSLSPNAFLMQEIHLVVLTGENHVKLWNKVIHDELKKVAPAEVFPRTEVKLDMFAKGAGTVLIFQDTDKVEEFKKKFALYADEMANWSEQDAGIVLVNMWNSLTEACVGATIQHYNPLINEAVAKEFNIPKNWLLNGQLVFGGIVSRPEPDESRLSGDELVEVR